MKIDNYLDKSTKYLFFKCGDRKGIDLMLSNYGSNLFDDYNLLEIHDILFMPHDCEPNDCYCNHGIIRICKDLVYVFEKYKVNFECKISSKEEMNYYSDKEMKSIVKVVDLISEIRAFKLDNLGI